MLHVGQLKYKISYCVAILLFKLIEVSNTSKWSWLILSNMLDARISGMELNSSPSISSFNTEIFISISPNLKDQIKKFWTQMCIFIEFYYRTICKNLCNIKMYRTVASFNVTPCTSLLLPVLRSFLVTLYIAHLWKNISFLTALNMTRPSVTLIVGSNACTYK